MTTDKFAHVGRYVMIVDFNHVMHRFYNAMGRLGLSTVLEIDGEYRRIDTGVAKGVLQFLVKLSRSGTCPMVIVHDLPVQSRKQYFSQGIADGKIFSKQGDYKGDRPPLNYAMRDSADMVLTMLSRTGAVVLGKENYEADDIIPAVIKVAKEQYPNLPIYILANDLDLAPLVDEQVSLYRYPTKKSFAFEGHALINKYCQVTPDNYQKIIEASTAVKGLYVPYNSLLLAKLIRGDKSDNVSIMQGWTPTKYNKLISRMEEDGVDLRIFSYHPWAIKYEDKATGELFDTRPATAHAGNTRLRPVRDEGYKKMVEVLKGYLAPEGATAKEIKAEAWLTQEDLDEILYRYDGMNLNGVFSTTPTKRRPYELSKSIKIVSLDVVEIIKAAQIYQMNIKQ